MPGLAPLLAVVAALATAWLASGAMGAMALGFRNGLAWLGLAIMVGAAWQAGQPPWPLSRQVLGSFLGLAAAAWLVTARSPSASVLGAALATAAVASWHKGTERQTLLLAAWAIAALGVYRLALASIPAVWLAGEQLAFWLGELATAVTGRPLAVGPTYAALELLLPVLCLYAGGAAQRGRFGWSRAVAGLLAMVGVHLGYLALLAWSADLLAALPVPQPPPVQTRYIPPPWHWSDFVRAAVPWNLPMLGAAAHLAAVALWFRWTACPSLADRGLAHRPGPQQPPRLWGLATSPGALAGVAFILAALTSFVSPLKSLEGKSVVALDLPSVNWSRPEHGKFGRAAGEGFGTLSDLVESLGAGFRRSSGLAEADLATADVLVVLPPAEPFPAELSQRVWQYVRSGGALLVVAEPSVHEGSRSSLFADLLEPTSIRVRFDVATAVSALWEDSLDPASHPAIAGLITGRNRLGLGQAASLEIGWPAWPLLAGRFGWSDPGVDALLTGRRRLEPGERLGDLVLAAEQTVGPGTVIVLGDSRLVTNEGIPYSYEFLARLLTYLAHRPSPPQAPWRAALAVAFSAALLGVMAVRLDPWRLGLAVAVLAIGQLGFEGLGTIGSRVLPGARSGVGPPLAVVDGSHLEPFSDHPWNSQGITGLNLNMLRNGWLPLVASRWDVGLIERARVLVLVAPRRLFSAAEQAQVLEFLENGGTVLAFAGADQAEALHPLLERFGIAVPAAYRRPDRPIREPAPMGRYPPLKSQEYYEVLRFVDRWGEESSVAFYARWPFECPPEFVEVQDYEGRPAVAVVPVGQGNLVFIPDSGLVLNNALEDAEGAMVGGARENAGFLRWLLKRSTAGRPGPTQPNSPQPEPSAPLPQGGQP